jgi:hypothetical protein
MKLAIALLVCLAACGDSKPGSKDPYVLRAHADKLVEIERDFARIETAWLAEASYGDRRAALVWPALVKGEVADDDVLWVVFERDGTSWRPISGEKEQEIDLRDDAAGDRLRAALGGDPVFVRLDGYPIDQLASEIHRAARSFQARPSIETLEQFARGFDLQMFADGNQAADWLLEILPAIDRMTIDPDGATLRATVDGKEQSIPVRLTRSGAGWTIAAIGG